MLPHALTLGLVLGTFTSVHAQVVDIEAWMQRHFSGTPGLKQDAKADEALYAAIGLDSLRTNRFIGEVGGTVKRPNGAAPVQFVLWSDTLEAILHYHTPGDTTTYHADIRTNTIAIHQTGTEEGEVNSSLNDLRERVVANWYHFQDHSKPWRVYRRKPYDRNGGLLGQDMARWTAVNGDTIQFTRYKHGHSPFVDALEWLPYGGDHPFNLIMQLARAGDPMPQALTAKAGTIRVEIKRMGPGPRPSYRTGSTVIDTRTKSHHALPIRKSNRRATVVELDPVVVIPDDQLHLYGTADPGDPNEPEVTFRGNRSQAHVRRKSSCGDTGTVVVKVWIDRNGVVQRAEVDKKKSTLRSETCWNSALDAAKRDTYYPIEAAIPLDQGEVTIVYEKARTPAGSNDAPGGTYGGAGGGSGTGAFSSRAPFSWELQGRTVMRQPALGALPKGNGKVVLDVWVGRTGKVLRTEIGRGSTTNDTTLVDAARQVAMATRFSTARTAPEEQHGRLLFVFGLE